MAILLWEVSCRAHVRSSVVITVLSTRSGTLTSTKEKQREGATSVRFSFVRGEGVRLHVVNHSFKGPLNKKCTLGAQSARDVSSAVSGFCQVFIYSDPREMFFSRLRPTAEDVSALADTENFRRRRENPLVPRVLQTMHCAKRVWTTTVVNATDLQFLCHEVPIHYSLIRLLVPCLYVSSSLCQSASTRIARWLPPF